MNPPNTKFLSCWTVLLTLFNKCFCFSNCVSTQYCAFFQKLLWLQKVLTKAMVFLTTIMFRVIIYIYWFDCCTLGNVGCDILLLPVLWGRNGSEKAIFWQVGDDWGMWVTPAWCRLVGITALDKVEYKFSLPDYQVECISSFTDFRLKRAGQLSCYTPVVNLDWHHLR